MDKTQDFELNTPDQVKAAIQQVYEMLQNREIHPSGTFDRQGRFYLQKRSFGECQKPIEALAPV